MREINQFKSIKSIAIYVQSCIGYTLQYIDCFKNLTSKYLKLVKMLKVLRTTSYTTYESYKIWFVNKYDWFKILVYNKNLDFETEMSRDKGEKQRHWRLYYYHTRTLGRFIIIIIIIIIIFVKNIRPINWNVVTI